MQDGLLKNVENGDLIVDLNGNRWGINVGIVFGETGTGRIRYIELNPQADRFRQDKTYAKDNSKTIKVTLEQAKEYVEALFFQRHQDEDGLAAEAYMEHLESLL